LDDVGIRVEKGLLFIMPHRRGFAAVEMVDYNRQIPLVGRNNIFDVASPDPRRGAFLQKGAMIAGAGLH
jgi:hypothetical protein